MKDEWKCVTTTLTGQCVMIAGTALMPESSADNWDILSKVTQLYAACCWNGCTHDNIYFCLQMLRQLHLVVLEQAHCHFYWTILCVLVTRATFFSVSMVELRFTTVTKQKPLELFAEVTGHGDLDDYLLLSTTCLLCVQICAVMTM